MTVVWRQASVLVDAELSCQPERCCTKTLSVSCTLCLLTKQYNSVPAGIQEHYMQRTGGVLTYENWNASTATVKSIIWNILQNDLVCDYH